MAIDRMVEKQNSEVTQTASKILSVQKPQSLETVAGYIKAERYAHMNSLGILVRKT